MPSDKKESFLGGGRPVGKSEMDEGKIDEGYDSKNYYLRSIDKQGNRDVVRVETAKFPPFLVAKLMTWVNDPRTPYRSAGDMIRDAVAHRAHQLDVWDKRGDTDWVQYSIEEQRSQAASVARDMNAQTIAFQQDFAEAMQIQDYQWARELIKIGQRALETFREPYRSRVEQVLKPVMTGELKILES